MNFKDLVDGGLALKAKVNNTIFCLTRVNFSKDYYILSADEEDEVWDIVGVENNFKEAELCFCTEVSRYRDLSYKEV